MANVYLVQELQGNQDNCWITQGVYSSLDRAMAWIKEALDDTDLRVVKCEVNNCQKEDVLYLSPNFKDTEDRVLALIEPYHTDAISAAGISHALHMDIPRVLDICAELVAKKKITAGKYGGYVLFEGGGEYLCQQAS